MYSSKWFFSTSFHPLTIVGKLSSASVDNYYRKRMSVLLPSKLKIASLAG